MFRTLSEEKKLRVVCETSKFRVSDRSENLAAPHNKPQTKKMAPFLSEPVTKKVSSDASNGKLICGSSSMQGWRPTQEDAHNCIVDYDTDTSFFAVYDGHSGPNVALYCSENLPDFLKQTGPYKDGDFKRALEDAFLGLDAKIAALSVEADHEDEESEEDDKNAEEEEEDLESEGSDEENMYDLYEEAGMPIEKVMEKYASKLPVKTEKCLDLLPVKRQKSSACSSASCSSKSSSSQAAVVVSSSSNMKTEASSSSVDKRGKSESSETRKKSPVPEKRVDSPDSSVSKSDACVHSNKSEVISEVDSSNQNGEVESSQGDKSNNCEVVTSSSMPQENGTVHKTGKGKALKKTKGAKPPKVNTRPKRSARQLYNKLVEFEEDSDEEEESEDENDKDFIGPNEESSDDDGEGIKPSPNDDDSEEGSSGEEEEEESDEVFFSNCGSTAVVALIRDKKLYVASAGDSRCIICRDGGAVELSSVHRPTNKQERERIIKAGGHVTPNGKVNNEFDLSRTIGDHKYKQNKELPDREQMITALPEVRTLTLVPGVDEFLFLACESVCSNIDSQKIINFVGAEIRKGEKKLSEICEECFDKSSAINSSGSGKENMTAIIVQFKSNSLKRSADDVKESDSSKKLKTEEIVDSTQSNIA